MRKIFLIRHGETEWSKSGQHTSYTDLCLTEKGRKEVLKLKNSLPDFSKIFISPLLRARQTAELLELKGVVKKELVEWNYGIYEGKTTKEIQIQQPGWNIFTHGALFGETINELEVRIKKIISHLSSLDGNIGIISSGHFIRTLISLYLDQPCSFGQNLLISTASISILTEDRGIKVLQSLNLKS